VEKSYTCGSCNRHFQLKVSHKSICPYCCKKSLYKQIPCSRLCEPHTEIRKCEICGKKHHWEDMYAVYDTEDKYGYEEWEALPMIYRDICEKCTHNSELADYFISH